MQVLTMTYQVQYDLTLIFFPGPVCWASTILPFFSVPLICQTSSRLKASTLAISPFGTFFCSYVCLLLSSFQPFFFPLATPRDMWDLSSLTRDQNYSPSRGSMDYLSLWPQIHMCGPSTEREEACVCLVAQPCLTICDSMDCSPPGCSVRGITGVSCHFLLQGTFPTQGSNPGLPHCRQTL